MKTKITILLTAFFMLPAFSFANQTDEYNCDAFLPEGTAEMTVTWAGETIQVEIKFHNKVINKTFPGTFYSSTKLYNSQAGSIAAHGAFMDGNEVISAVVQGRLMPNDHGVVAVSLGASWDHRIEYGYGNHLICTKLN